jgi:transposase
MATKRTAEVKGFLKLAKGLGFKIWQVAVTLRGKGYSNAQVARVLGVHEKTVQAYNTNFTQAGKAEWKDGKRVHRAVTNYLKAEYSKAGKGLHLMEMNKFNHAVKELVGEAPKHKVAK